jgi:predicted transcriptional regulator
MFRRTGQFRRRSAGRGGDTTGKTTVRDISEGCEVSHRTAQKALRRLAMQCLMTPLEHESGSAEGRRYRLSAEALRD